MCRYCEKLDDNPRILFGDGIMEVEINSSIKKLEVHYNGAFECADFDYEDGFDINYCPICGRKLGSQEIKTIKWIECDDSFVRICLDNKTHNSKFKLYCTARGNEGIIYAYRFNEESNQYEYCILENNKYKWINNNGYCKFFYEKTV